MKVNFTGVKPSKAPTPIVGWREATVVEGEAKISKSDKNAGSTYVNWKIRINDDQEDGGRNIRHNTSLVDDARPMLMAFLQAVGIDCDGEVEFKINEEDDEPGEAVVGRQLRVKCAPDGDYTKVVGCEPISESSGEGSLLV